MDSAAAVRTRWIACSENLFTSDLEPEFRLERVRIAMKKSLKKEENEKNRKFWLSDAW